MPVHRCVIINQESQNLQIIEDVTTCSLRPRPSQRQHRFGLTIINVKDKLGISVN